MGTACRYGADNSGLLTWTNDDSPAISGCRHATLRRATFGAPRSFLEELGLEGMTRGAAADALLALRQQRYGPGGPFVEIAQAQWIKNLVKGKRPEA